MTSDPAGARRSRYFVAGNHLVGLDQSVYSAFRHLTRGYTRNRLAALGMSPRLARRAAAIVARSRIRQPAANRLLELPAHGQLGLRVHRGYKIFDFDALEVTKVFDADVEPEAARREISAVTLASRISAAPDFHGAADDLSCYREELVPGIHATDPEFRARVSLADECYPDAERCLLELAALEPPAETDTAAHTERLANGAFRRHWEAAGMDPAAVAAIADYMLALRDWLQANAPDRSLALVLAHGDFSLVNALSTPAGLRFVDWEGIAPGGLYSDLFNFVFVERYYRRVGAEFADLLADLLGRYRSACSSRLPELAAAAETDRGFARRQYYLERLRVLVDRAPSANLSNVTLRSIEMFEAFEREQGMPLT